ncbi:uncharacterized protein LOC105179436 [Sesamum indicum]|uniref:Uncharacterized protein LOC105179436 n=1 Tax=Sesamum indicum TaxID=4182 RepID=A0A6I9UI17_SESIN|nr:uncharacterized protein LOC105179436 [Sesamum indicum]
MVLNGDLQQQYGGMFRFENYLAHSPEFIPSVQNIWQHNIIGMPMHAVTRKLKALKPIFREQRRNKGGLSHNVHMAKGFLEAAQLLVSSRRRDELYIQLEHCCRLVLAKVTKLEQIMLNQRAKMQWMKGGDQCSRVFFRKIAQRRLSRRIFQINDVQGSTHTDPEEVINEFVTYYQNLLGGDRRRASIDIRFLRPWARHILSNEELPLYYYRSHQQMSNRRFLTFAEDKAPGLDEYSSGFFKAAWPIVGQEIIAKLIVQRLSVIMDKLINPCQAAFVPGRSIGDNIMLAQELFKGYNQTRLPPRCDLKVDIRKAYDTVYWDFLIVVMEMFGFPITFVKWIEECVTTPSFSVGLSGKPHGFFRGARGLRSQTERAEKPPNISCSAQALREEMLALLGFQEGVLPMRGDVGATRISGRGSSNEVSGVTTYIVSTYYCRLPSTTTED